MSALNFMEYSYVLLIKGVLLTVRHLLKIDQSPNGFLGLYCLWPTVELSPVGYTCCHTYHRLGLNCLRLDRYLHEYEFPGSVKALLSAARIESCVA